MMPRYIYSSESGDLVADWVGPFKDRPTSISVNGATLYYDAALCAQGFARGNPCGTWPLKCYALGVQSDQRQEAMQHCEEMGVPTYYDEDGDPTITDNAHYSRFKKMQGFFDRDAGYSGVCPGETIATEREFDD